MSVQRASKWARTMGYAALIGLGELLGTLFHPYWAVTATWTCLFVLAAAVLDYHAWSRSR